jgi:Dolichyl-phosphate-mannose-protein mannosyltransferase
MGARANGKRDRLIALALGIATVSWLLVAEKREGFGRDEGQYMRAAERYWGWFEELADNIKHHAIGRSFAQPDIDRYWSDNAPDHPVIMKTLYGLSWRAFHRCTCMGPARGYHPIPVRGRHITLPLFARDSTAFRFPAMLFSGLLIAMVYLFARRFVPRPAAAAGAVLALAQPHYFFHAPIACFDAPITTMAFAVGFAYWKSLRSARWGVACGVIFGIALGTKHNAWLMPIFLAAHYLWMRRDDLLRRRRLPRVPLAFVTMATLGPLIFLLHWPWLWPAPLARTQLYLNRHLQHEHYNFEFLGLNWNNPPTTTALKLIRATFPFVSTGLTVPVTTLALALWGAVVLLRRRRGAPVVEGGSPEAPEALEGPTRPSWLRPGADVDRAPGAFLAVQIFGPLCVLAVPSTPIFGGVKHFMPAMPFLAIAAAIGVATLTRTLVAALIDGAGRPRLTGLLPAALAALVCLPAVAETERSQPDGLSHYNLIAGGFAGGASLGMNRQFWAYCVLPMLNWVNEDHADNHRMYWHDVLGDALHMYKREGRLALDVGDTGPTEAGIQASSMGLLVWEKHWAIYEGWFWESYGTVKPAFVRDREGVPLVIGYKRSVR